MMCHITSLESAGMSWESYAATLGPIVVGKIPSEMRLEWRKIEKKYKLPNGPLHREISQLHTGRSVEPVNHYSVGR